jgi:23S rRNA pseudouridine1911/1915/1917 synthase
VSERIELTAGPEQAGQRLDVALAAHPAVGSRAAAQKLLDAGAVSVDGRPRSKSHRLVDGERIAADQPVPVAVDPGAAGEDVPFEVVFEDEHLLVVDKPAGVVTHPAPGVVGPTLVAALRGLGLRGGDDEQRPGVIHRLDRDTSGLLVLTRSDEAYAALGEQMRARRIEREYVALVRGRPPSRRGTIDAPVGRDRNDVGRMAVGGRAERPAVTHFELAEPLVGSSLLHLKLETGRTHQIRVHLAAIAHPVVGDRTYGRGGTELGLERQFLHAARLAFDHPMTGERVELTSRLPDDLQAALDEARAE